MDSLHLCVGAGLESLAWLPTFVLSLICFEVSQVLVTYFLWMQMYCVLIENNKLETRWGIELVNSLTMNKLAGVLVAQKHPRLTRRKMSSLNRFEIKFKERNVSGPIILVWKWQLLLFMNGEADANLKTATQQKEQWNQNWWTLTTGIPLQQNLMYSAALLFTNTNCVSNVLKKTYFFLLLLFEECACIMYVPVLGRPGSKVSAEFVCSCNP